MKVITKLLFAFVIILTLSASVFAREIDDFIYDGKSLKQSVFLSHVDMDNYGNYRQIKTEARLLFDNSSKEMGENTTITVNMNGVDIGMMASADTNVLSLLKLKSVDRWFTENTVNVLMEVEIKFIQDLKSQVRPLRNPIMDLNVLDDFVSFTSGKIVDTKNLIASVQIFRKKSFGKDDLIFEKKFNEGEYVVSQFGADRSLVTIDLNQYLANVERGKKYIVKVFLAPNFGKWRPFTASQAELFMPSETKESETVFRYSKLL
jgi:hypothetical protein